VFFSIKINESKESTREELEETLGKKLNNLKVIEKTVKNSEYIKDLSDIALIQIELEQYQKAEKNLSTCLLHFTKQKDRLGQAAVFGLLGTLYFKKGDFQKSLNNYQNAYDIYSELKQVGEQIMTLKGMGNCLIKLNELEEACDIFLNCSAICTDHKDIYNFLDCLGNLIYIHEIQENWDIIFELYKKSLAAFKELKDNRGIITSYFNLGILQRKSNKNRNALKYFKKGTNAAIDSNYAEMIIKGLSYVAETLFYLGKVKEASGELVKSLYLAEKIDAKNAIIQIKILLKSFGLGDEDIRRMVQEYRRSREKEPLYN
jgi:tetratricopeptide (TPR) repeat protein